MAIRIPMLVRSMFLVGATCAVVAVCAGLLLARQGLEADCSVRGTVVNSVTGEPIHNALVTLGSAYSRSVFSKVDGSFEFRGLRAGRGYVFASRPGYFSPNVARMSQHSTSQNTLPVTIGPDQAPLVLQLVPEGVIAGRVSGEDGAPIESILVRLFFEGAEDGRWTLQETPGTETDGNGEFRKAELPGGRYFVFVGPGGDPATASNGKGGAGFGYGAGFYPGGVDFASASPVDVTPGKQADVDVRLSMVPFYRLTGTVRGIPAGEVAHLELLDSAGEPFDTDSVSAREQGRFRFGPLASGSYTIEAKNQQQTLSAVRPLLLKSDMAGVDLTVAEGVSIPVSVKSELDPNDVRTEGPGYEQTTRGNSVTRNFTRGRAVEISLIPQKMALVWRRGFPASMTGSRNEFVLEHVQAGTYEVKFQPIGGYYVQSAISGSTDLLRENLTVAGGASVETIQVVLRNDFGSLEGKVSYDANASAAIVVAICENVPQRHVIANVNGGMSTYSLESLAPGTYRVLAVDRVDNFAYLEPEVLQKYQSKMKEVTIAPNGKAQLDLELVKVGSPAP